MALRIAARGWEHPAWSGPFYPADLPAEWRLIYFCNHFDALVVPEGRWRGAEQEWAEWGEACAGATRVFLEHAGEPDAVARTAAEALGGAFGGFVASDRAEPAVGRWEGGDLRALRGCMEALAPRAPETLLIIQGAPPSLETLRNARTLAGLLGLG